MSKCCKEECATAYCPHCGKAICVDPLKGLLRHVAAHAKAQASRGTGPFDCSDLEKFSTESDSSFRRRKERVGRNRESRARALRKWESWRDALVEMIERDTAEGGGPG